MRGALCVRAGRAVSTYFLTEPLMSCFTVQCCITTWAAHPHPLSSASSPSSACSPSSASSASPTVTCFTALRLDLQQYLRLVTCPPGIMRYGAVLAPANRMKASASFQDNQLRPTLGLRSSSLTDEPIVFLICSETLSATLSSANEMVSAYEGATAGSSKPSTAVSICISAKISCVHNEWG